ncbi:MAG: anhydro-N-acetylmuramic acid kinase [Balneolaceae bacterium]|nr:anhydro-N-acetylmuramic acid kinase [Balneolaceae bacterium]
MNQVIGSLTNIASKQRRKIVGLMSGTSLDGLDIVLCEITGSGENTMLKIENFKTVHYPPDIVKRMRTIISVETASLQEVCLANSWLANFHADLVLETLADWDIDPSEIDCIASHGQTIYHAPFVKHREEGLPNATLQIGDGDHIARKTGILTISDFRQKHTAAGGEGAPMVSLTDRLLFTHRTESRCMLNIGGIANFAFLPSEQSQAEYVTTDTGPGNTMINAVVQRYFDKDYDEDGDIAASGSVQARLLTAMLEDSYFKEPLPKTTGPELFNTQWVQDKMEEANSTDISPENLVATLTWFTAQSIASSIQTVIEGLTEEQTPVIYLSGGGMHNDTLVKWLDDLLEEIELKSFEVLGYLPDAKEAASFAVLANETLCRRGLPDRSETRHATQG